MSTDLSIADLLTKLQRRHIENLLKLAEGEELPNAQVLAQINRFLADNGILLGAPGQPERPMIDVTPNREEPPALPDYTGQRYDE